ncbi:inorganic phosphate transporter [Coleofasciculus sp. G2-EDA-02]|uniref:inorganic phosphate transporter n=1 Tax=Coleofasciculus sp. G2-EDA-02 TaxID=3069529 RepID=UPI0032FF06AF
MISIAVVQLGLTAILAFYVAWNLGANDVANSMGTSVGSKAVTLRQALIIAGILEFTGAVLFGQGVATTLATKVIDPTLFAQTPQVLLLGMTSVLLACGLWLQIATSLGLPVASSHAVVGAIAGFCWVAIGVQAVDWGTLGRISLTWIITPVISGILAAGFYGIINTSILRRTNPIVRLREWIPWLSALLLSIFGAIVMPSLFNRPLFYALPIPAHDLPIITVSIAAIVLSLISWHQLESGSLILSVNPEESRDKGIHNGEGEIEANIVPPPNSVSPFPSPIEQQLARFQVLSACFVAFAHGSNDVGNAIAPLAVIAYIIATGTVPLTAFNIPLWILIVGGAGIVAGLAVWGKKVITTVGENIIPLQPSSGFCAEIATATTVLLASRFGFPVSTSHALVGGIVGIGLIQNWRTVRFQTLKSIALAWLITLPAAASLGAIIFISLRVIFL